MASQNALNLLAAYNAIQANEKAMDELAAQFHDKLTEAEYFQLTTVQMELWDKADALKVAFRKANKACSYDEYCEGQRLLREQRGE